MFNIILSFLLAFTPVPSDDAVTRQQMCTEVMIELTEAVSQGIITEAEALLIGMNCLNG